ncbi:MAG: phosphatase PAP2 family protein [Balneolaceae bacterium]|nr:phosphatase PAP2 family protein [Balneolaceae bacterium]MCH8548398.1 phosphatase PAP2 family protein [Balneolaceae bacterium]
MSRLTTGATLVFLLMMIATASHAQNLNGFHSGNKLAIDANFSEFDAADIAFDRGDSGWWTRRYLLDYAIVTAGFTGYLIGKDLEPRSNSMIGPTYDPENLLDLFDSDKLNRTYLEQDVGESVPEYLIHRSIAVSGGFLIGMEWMEQRNGRGSSQRIHQTFVGYAEAVAVNAAITELLKPVFARLRPDFRERALRFHCPDLTGEEFEPFCSDFRDRPLADDPSEAQDLLDDGRKSFYSGHSSNSFALFGYTAMAIGGRYVWGEDATRRSRITGITLQAGALSYATYISASRVSDGRHFVSDTIVGAAAGLTIAGVSYFRRFHRNGEMRGERRQSQTERSSVAVAPWVGGDGSGVSLSLNF